LALWALTAIIRVGGVRFSRWRLQRRRLAVLLAWLAPWAVAPLYVILLVCVASGHALAARSARTVLAIGLGEGIATILGGTWIVAAHQLG
jgi:hypothetical protein